LGAATKFGLGSEEEMCIDFVGYWPRDALAANNQYCGYKASGSLTQSGEIASFARQFGKAGVVDVVRCSLSSTENPCLEGGALFGSTPVVVLGMTPGACDLKHILRSHTSLGVCLFSHHFLC
jgi:hypothetical protein